jgi:hypothetical protein
MHNAIFYDYVLAAIIIYLNCKWVFTWWQWHYNKNLRFRRYSCDVTWRLTARQRLCKHSISLEASRELPRGRESSPGTSSWMPAEASKDVSSEAEECPPLEAAAKQRDWEH